MLRNKTPKKAYVEGSEAIQDLGAAASGPWYEARRHWLPLPLPGTPQLLIQTNYFISEITMIKKKLVNN